MYGFLLRPRWILSHILAVCVVALCVAAGLWQLSRLDEKRSANARFEERAALPVADLAGLLAPDAGPDQVSAVELRRVEVTGTYQLSDQVRVANRTYGGAPGYWLLTPLLASDGTGVVVNRGWVPLEVVAAERLGEADPPRGEVRVIGTVTASQQRGGIGPTDSAGVSLDELARADVARLAAQLTYPVLPAYLSLIEQEPVQGGELPLPVRPVEPGEGPHLGYAFQWFTFATIAAGGYPLILRKVARERDAPDEGSARRRRASPVPVDD